MKNRVYIIIIMVATLGLSLGLEQTSFSQSVIVPRNCATMEQDSINRVRYPQRGTLSDFEYDLQLKIRELETRNKGKRTQATLLTIPVVFHIVHNGEPVGSGTNLSVAQVQAQIAVLNEDFRRLQGTPGYNDDPAGADIEIEFCLSPLDENGLNLSEPGIHRYNGNKASWSRTEIENQLKPITIWNPNLFYNIWSLKFSTADANLLGYAQFPDQSGLTGLPASGPASTDGVVVRYQSIGSADKGTFPVMEAPYNKGRTLTHETGHWLGLRHIWGDGNCAEDFVSDTPPASGPSSGCPIGRVSCGGPNMVENYMDYSYDACMNIFTQGQKVRMLAVMEVSPRRKTLTQASLCSPIVADVPTPNFSVDRQQVLKGGEAYFTDLSTNFPNNWLWSFEGGDPEASTDRNPRIKYVTPGSYKVTLVAINSLGASEPLIREGYIQVSEEGLCGKFSNYAVEYTPSVLSISGFAPYTGYLTGHNTSKTKAVAEYFRNQAGYEYISGVNIHFGKVDFDNEDAYVYVTVWNARGPQNAPGSIIERKLVLLKQIKEDIENNRPTNVVFDRETPVLNRPFQVGIELEYSNGESVAITSSANGEALNASSWIQDQSGRWDSYAIAYGANIAMDIQPFVGMNPSVQVSSSKQLVYPGEEVTLNGRGASIFIWDSSDGSIQDFAGPQLKFNPLTTTTILTVGSGLDLCLDSAYTTIYVRENVVGIIEKSNPEVTSLFPNPGDQSLNIRVQGEYRGPVFYETISSIGQQKIISGQFEKTSDDFVFPVNTAEIPTGLYVVRIKIDQDIIVKKWIKL
jgi:PKD repeat protein